LKIIAGMDTARCHWNIFGLPLEYWRETVILGRVKPAKPQVCKQFRMGIFKSYIALSVNF